MQSFVKKFKNPMLLIVLNVMKERKTKDPYPNIWFRYEGG